VLRINPLPIHDDVEDSAATGNQLRLDAGVPLDRVRQTGGLGEIVSLLAVGDGDVGVGHGWSF
jgi:hypothetical protein